MKTTSHVHNLSCKRKNAFGRMYNDFKLVSKATRCASKKLLNKTVFDQFHPEIAVPQLPKLMVS